MSKKMKLVTIVVCVCMLVFSSALLLSGAKIEAQADNKKGAYLEFRLSSIDGNPVSGIAYEVYQNDNLIDVMVSNEEGIATSTELPLGYYTYKMVQCNNYFEFDSNTYQIQIEEEKANIINVNLRQASYSIFLDVTDELGNKIKGLTYTICKDDGSLDTLLVSSDNQEPGLSGLRPGGYIIKLISAPEWMDVELGYDYVVTLCNKDIVCKITYDTKGRNILPVK